MALMAVPFSEVRKKRKRRPKKIKYLHDCYDCRHRRLDTCDFVTRRTGLDCVKKPIWMTTGKAKYKLCESHKAELKRLTGDHETFVRFNRKPFE